jgi:hypothetical protein
MDLFGPLSKDYCLYFYFLSIAGFVFFAFILIMTLIIGIRNKKGFNFYMKMLVAALIYLVFYFQNRLLYSMCA